MENGRMQKKAMVRREAISPFSLRMIIVNAEDANRDNIIAGSLAAVILYPSKLKMMAAE